MLAVIGSRHDAVAVGLTELWPNAELCAAEDLISPGWSWGMNGKRRTWVIGGQRCADEEVTGVFLRRSTVLPEEFLGLHPEDRRFAAAEAGAFLTFVLATTSGRVINPVVDGGFGEESIRPERWMASAQALGVAIRVPRISDSRPLGLPTRVAWRVEVVGAEVFGDAPKSVIEAARKVADAERLAWVAIAFDSRLRMLGMTCSAAPSHDATAALGRLLAQRQRK